MDSRKRAISNDQVLFVISGLIGIEGGFGGLEVSVLASGIRVRGFKTGRRRWIFRAKKSPARFPSEGK